MLDSVFNSGANFFDKLRKLNLKGIKYTFEVETFRMDESVLTIMRAEFILNFLDDFSFI
jgi:hypothetical protein